MFCKLGHVADRCALTQPHACASARPVGDTLRVHCCARRAVRARRLLDALCALKLHSIAREHFRVRDASALQRALCCRPFTQDISAIRDSRGDVFFVKWVSVEAKTARRVRLDENNKVIAIVPYAVEIEDFVRAKVIIANTGVPMVQRSKAGRLPMTRWCLLKVLHERIKTFGGPMSPDCMLSGLDKCVVCQCCQEDDVDTAPSITKADVMVCSMCLSVWHVDCATCKLFGKPIQRDDNSWVCAVCNES